jgi:hypothetical protein
MARIPKDAPQSGMDITLNWRCLDINNKGVFYTDSSAYKIIKRDIYKSDYPKDKALDKVPVPSYYYPVNSAIFIESA